MENVPRAHREPTPRDDRRSSIPAVAATLADGARLEMVFDREEQTTGFVKYANGSWTVVPKQALPDGRTLVPYSPHNNLLEHGVVRFPSGPQEYGNLAALRENIGRFIHANVSVSPRFERVATSYVLLTWLFDTFNEMPYLRVRGEPGSGKTRFLLIVGALCYRPIFASGASSVSPLFRILDAMQGTLILDESDFRFSDERADVVKILNNGNVRGFPVLRTESTPGGREFNPRAFAVYGPKIVASRGSFDDPALESRFLTEQMDPHALRSEIPINLATDWEREALRIRNMLLLYRFRQMEVGSAAGPVLDSKLEPRLRQIFGPLYGVTGDEETRSDLDELMREYDVEMAADRGLELEAMVLGIAANLWRAAGQPPAVKAIAERFVKDHGSQYPHVSPKRAGWILRRRLGLRTAKSNGRFVIAFGEEERFARLCERFGVAWVSPQTAHE